MIDLKGVIARDSFRVYDELENEIHIFMDENYNCYVDLTDLCALIDGYTYDTALCNGKECEPLTRLSNKLWNATYDLSSQAETVDILKRHIGVLYTQIGELQAQINQLRIGE